MSDDTPQHPQITSVEEIRARRAHPHFIVLPESGATVRIEKVTVLELAANGRIPDDLTKGALTGLIEALEDSITATPDEARRSMRRHIELINVVACSVLAEPRMTMQPSEGAITPEDLPFDDRFHLYNIALGLVRGPNLAPFPGEPRADLEAVADGEGLRDEAVGLPGAG